MKVGVIQAHPEAKWLSEHCYTLFRSKSATVCDSLRPSLVLHLTLQLPTTTLLSKKHLPWQNLNGNRSLSAFALLGDLTNRVAIVVL